MKPIEQSELTHSRYEIMTEEYQWKIIDLSQPLLPQLRGMRGYRLTSLTGMVYESSLHTQS